MSSPNTLLRRWPACLALFSCMAAGAAAEPRQAQTVIAVQAATAADANAGKEATTTEPAPAASGDDELYREALRALNNEQPERAAALLQRFLSSQPRHAGAWLDLALSQCALGREAEAERLFKEVENRFSPPPGIQELINQHRLRGCASKPSWKPLWIFTLGRGYDDNINQGASNSRFSTGSGADQIQWELASDFLPKADRQTLAGFDYMQQLDEAGSLVLAQVRVRENDEVRQQDYASLLVGYERPWQWGKWRGFGTVSMSLFQLEHKLYQRQEQVQLRATPPLNLGDQLQWSLLASLSHVRYPTRVRYDSNTLELGSSLFWRGKRQVSLAFSGLTDRGQDGRVGGDRNGVYGALQVSQPLSDRLRADFGLSRQVWRSDEVYAPGQIDVVRRQNTLQARAALQWALTPNQSVQLEWRAIRNKENISLFQYNSRLIQLNWRWDNF